MAVDEEVLSLAGLFRIMGRGMKKKSFANYVVRLKKEEGFPSQRVLTKRSTGWLWSEVNAWLRSRPISDASRSPNQKAKAERMTREQRIARLREVCLQRTAGLSLSLKFLKGKP